jgi:ABC-type branched-subunit amino acid transport system ATPase component/predicted MFS family arabinose efflux permease
VTATQAPAPSAPAPGNWFARWCDRTTGGAALFPLVVLFGLNAVDELGRYAFGVLLPNIRDDFGVSTQGILTVVAFALIGGLVLALPIGFLADRLNRVYLVVIAGILLGTFTILTAVAVSVVMLAIARAGSELGRGFNDPVHNSLIPDYYDVGVRPRVYAVHRSANSVGQALGPLLGGILAFFFGWRAPFLFFAIPITIFVILALRLRDPVRGAHERRQMGASEEAVATEEAPPSWAESWRIVWQVRTLRRIFAALPFLALSIVGLLTLGSLFYEEIFGLNEVQRGIVAAVSEPAQIIGFFIGIPIATKLLARDPGLVLKFLAAVTGVVAVAWLVFSQAPNLPVAIGTNLVISGSLGLLAPGIYSVLSLTVPPKVRAFGFAVAALWIMPGLLMLPIIGGVADAYGIRTGLLLAAPVFVVGGLILASAGSQVRGDMQRVWAAAAAQSEVAYERRRGKVKQLLVRGVDVHYDSVQVLFGVDFEVDQGEIVALLGTNGAGKSTLLKAISGLVEASGGAIIFDGRDMTHTPPDEIAARGVTQVPGGQGVFPSLTVAENLRLAGWLQRRDQDEVKAATERVLGYFPVLADRMQEPASNLSGGQQQMLTLGMAFIGRPKLLMIDELSLGLAPTVIAQLLEIVKAIRDQGTTIILVEQSVNLALTLADEAYFMEKGEIRFHGPTAELLERPDVLRSVFLEGAGGATSSGVGPNGEGAPAPASGDGQHKSAAGAMRLEVTEVSKRFGGVTALHDVSFTAARAEILGFIGPNGAGKTTLFDVVCGFLPDDGGTIHLNTDKGSYDLARKSAQRRAQLGLGRSFQDGRLFPALTVAETIAVALETHVKVRDPLAAALHLPMVRKSERRVRERVDELIDMVGLSAFRDKFIHELSTGSRRIVDLACVLAHEPTVLLLDEPSSGIAQREAEALGPLLKRVRDALGATLLVIEHDLPLLTSIADRMIALDLGEIIAEGTPADVVRHPAVIASYLGTTESTVARSGAQGALLTDPRPD